MLTTYEKSLIFLVLIMAILASFFFYNKIKVEKAVLAQEKFEEKSKADLAKRIETLGLEAKAVSIYDIDANKELFSKNEHTPLPLASLVKTMTVILAMEKNSPGQKVKISEEAINQAGDNGLLVNEIWPLDDLARFTLISSSNDGAWALSENIENFVQLMNEKAKKIGMADTVFFNPTGLDISEAKAGAYGSAFDANQMAVYAFRARPDIFSITTKMDENFVNSVGHYVRNTDILTEKNSSFLFSKTGNTLLAGGNITVIIVNSEGHKVAITILGSSFNGRFTDMEKLVNIL